ncbi:unnamed protein product [Urochloa humidicola]
MGPEEVVAGSKRLREAADQGSDDDEDCRIVSKEEATPKYKAPRKRRARKPREPLGPAFVRHSTRTNKALAEFRNKSSVPSEKVETAPLDDSDQEATAEIVLEPKPLAMVPPGDGTALAYAGTSAADATPAPFLSVDNVQAMAVGYLKMQPSAVSAAALLESSDDE